MQFHITEESEGVFEARVRSGPNSVAVDLSKEGLTILLNNTPEQMNKVLGEIHSEMSGRMYLQ